MITRIPIQENLPTNSVDKRHATVSWSGPREMGKDKTVPSARGAESVRVHQATTFPAVRCAHPSGRPHS